MPFFKRFEVLGCRALSWRRHRASSAHGQSRRSRRLTARDAGLPALDVEEFFGPEIGAEAGFGHHVIGEVEREIGRDDAVAAVRDIGRTGRRG